MKRDIEKKLLKWKESELRKPLILQGARQVGKTYTLKEFGKSVYSDIIYLNFEDDPGLGRYFEDTLDPAKIIKQLTIHSKKEIVPHKTLIFFDEIQYSNRALLSLKYFNETANEYHITAAGSLMGISLSRPASFPVGKVNLLQMYPLTFREFLTACGHADLRELLENHADFSQFPGPLHKRLIGLLKVYYFTGGMPEVVKTYITTGDFEKCRLIQSQIYKTFALDFAKHAPAKEIPKILRIWDSLPAQLGKENKKFKYSLLKKGARAREYEDALHWIENYGLLYKCYSVSTPKLPLKSYINPGCFKVYVMDTGLLCALSNLPAEAVIAGNKLFTEFHGSLVENYIAQQLISEKETGLYYWMSAGNAEVDFLYEYKGSILPFEVKAGISPKSKSLRVYGEKYQPEILSRSTLLNFTYTGNICNYPLYAVFKFPELYFNVRK